MVLNAKLAMLLTFIVAVLGIAGATYTLTERVEAGGCSHCYKLESKCRRESKGQANCDAIVSRCLRQCRRGG